MATPSDDLFHLLGANILPKFSRWFPWEGEFANYAVDLARTGYIFMMQQSARGRDEESVRICITFSHRGQECEFQMTGMPHTFIPVARDVIARIGIPVAVDFNGMIYGDRRPSVDVTGLLRGSNIVSLRITGKTIIAHRAPGVEASWASHPLRALNINTCETTKFGWASICRIVRECPLREFYLVKGPSPLRGNDGIAMMRDIANPPRPAGYFHPKILMQAWGVCRTLTRLDIIVEGWDVRKTHFNPGRIIEQTAAFPHLDTIHVQSRHRPLEEHIPGDICRALALPRPRPLHELSLRLNFTDDALASIIDTIRENDNVSKLELVAVPSPNKTAHAIERIALQNGRMFDITRNLASAHWINRVRVVEAFLLSTHMPQILDSWDGNDVETFYIRQVKSVHLWRNPAYHDNIEEASFHSCTHNDPDSVFRYATCYLIHNVEAAALPGIFEGMPTETDAVAVGSTAVTWGHLAALARARPLLRAIALIKCAVVM